MDIFKPLQLFPQTQILTHNNKHYFVISIAMGINTNGETLLSVDFIKDAFEAIDQIELPDEGFPKPKGEFKVTGTFYAENNVPVSAGSVKIKLNEKEKELFIFGDRTWVNGTPSAPTEFTQLPIKYSYAYGGTNYKLNPNGIGFTGNELPNIENPKNIITSPTKKYEPSGLSGFSTEYSQRKKFEGTYDENYFKTFFPGRPLDFNWLYFMTTAEDQWSDEFYKGDESFEFYNLHPDKPIIKSKLPNLNVRCFLNHCIGSKSSHELQFDELPLNLDTIHFYPDKELTLLYFRGVIEVTDDEGEEIEKIVLGYEDQSISPLDLSHYYRALRLRLENDDPLLNNFRTQDLIPENHKTAMEILIKGALDDAGESELSQNLDAKSNEFQKFMQEQKAEIDKQIIGNNITDSNSLSSFDLKEMINNQDVNQDIDVDNFKKALNDIIPGITTGNVKEMDLNDFSFDKVDDISHEVQLFMDAKQASVKEELNKIKDLLKERLVVNVDEDTNAKMIEEYLNSETTGTVEENLLCKIPRVNLEGFSSISSELDPNLLGLMGNVNSIDNMGLNDVYENYTSNQQVELDTSIKQARIDFKEMYRVTAHFQKRGLSPHDRKLELVKKTFINKFVNGESLIDGDWACIDLSGENLESINLSGAYLEQVDFTNANLKGADFTGAILSRSNLTNANLTGAILKNSNIGDVTAVNTDFSEVDFTGAKLSKSNFYGAKFNNSKLLEIETLEINIDNAKFINADLTGIKIIDVDINGAIFNGSKLGASCFLQCKIENVSYDNASMPNVVWADTSLKNSTFVDSNLLSNCFAVTPKLQELNGGRLIEVNFSGAQLEKCNFQNIVMPNVNFQGAKVENCNFNGADMQYSNLSNASMKLSQFRKTNLSNGNLVNTNFEKSFFAKAVLVSANMKESNFYGVDFLGAVFGETNTSQSNFDATILKDWRPNK